MAPDRDYGWVTDRDRVELLRLRADVKAGKALLLGSSREERKDAFGMLQDANHALKHFLPEHLGRRLGAREG